MAEQERVAIFIDGANFYHALQAAFHRASLDFHKLSLALADERRLIRTYYYNARRISTDGKASDQQRFFDRLQKTPYLELKLGTLQPQGDTYVQKGVDVQLAVDMISFAFSNTYDTAILVSGDSDFVPAIELVKNLGKHVELAVVRGQPSNAVQNACDKVILLDKDLLESSWLSS